MKFCMVTLTFESVDKILRCDHSNESSLPVLTHGVLCFSKFYKMTFKHLVEICFWLNLALKGLSSSVRDRRLNGRKGRGIGDLCLSPPFPPLFLIASAMRNL